MPFFSTSPNGNSIKKTDGFLWCHCIHKLKTCEVKKSLKHDKNAFFKNILTFEFYLKMGNKKNILNDRNSFDLNEVTTSVGKLLEQYIKESHTTKTSVLKQQDPKAIALELHLEEHFKNGFASEDAIKEFTATYLKNTNHLRHPNYMGHQVAVAQDLSGIPELIHGTVNNPSSLYEMGPAGAAIEGFMINWMLSKLNWFKGDDLYDFKFKSDSGSGILTHGGSVANLTALSAARAAIAPEAWTEGNPNDLVVMGPETAHYSVARALSIMGMGKNAFIPVPVDSNEVIQADQLEVVYQQIKEKGLRVMAVIGNACATSTGLFDPLDTLANFCDKNKLWFHVDGAHGAVAILSEKEQHKVKGMERADSLIWDAHKMMRVPSLCTAVLFKNFQHQVNNFQQKGSYVFHENEVVGMDSMPYTVECTKSALGTKLFWTFALEGEAAITQYIETTFALAREFHQLLDKHPDFHCPYTPESNILCFQYQPNLFSDEELLKLRYKIIEIGDFYITSCVMNKKRFLRVTLMNPLTNRDSFLQLIECIQTTGKTVRNTKN